MKDAKLLCSDPPLPLVGSPAENLTLLDLPGTQEFIFRRLDTSAHKGELGIVNVHPEPEQQGIFYPTDSSEPLTEDYAIVALVPGLNAERHVLILAGTTTLGTQAAVEYVCGEDSLSERITFQATAQAFNVFNHPNLGQPNGCVDCGTSSGLITDIVASQDGSSMRRLQFAARFQF